MAGATALPGAGGADSGQASDVSGEVRLSGYSHRLGTLGGGRRLQQAVLHAVRVVRQLAAGEEVFVESHMGAQGERETRELEQTVAVRLHVYTHEQVKVGLGLKLVGGPSLSKPSGVNRVGGAAPGAERQVRSSGVARVPSG